MTTATASGPQDSAGGQSMHQSRPSWNPEHFTKEYKDAQVNKHIDAIHNEVRA